jgi:hypothetical protein
MATQVLSRKQKGDMIAPENIVQMNSSSFFVKSQSGKSGYAVTKFGQSWTCDCPDHRYRQIQCKHIHAVTAAKSETGLSLRFSLGLWEAPK